MITNSMRSKIVAVWISLAILFGTIMIMETTVDFIPTAKGTTLYVNKTGIGAYDKIQDAINASTDGDTVFVYNGTYYENIVVNKTINLTGYGRDNTIINGSGSGNTIEITVSYVNITGFTVTGCGSNTWDAGLDFSNADYCKVFNNNISSNPRLGINIRMFSNENEIINNNFFSNYDGIYLSSPNNTIKNNNFSSNNWNGINSHSSFNNVSHNNLYLNNYNGIYVKATYNYIANNNAYLNVHHGIYLAGADNNTIKKNNITNNDKNGMLLQGSDDNVVIDNNFIDNYGTGIAIGSTSSSNNVTNNIISPINGNGIHIASAYYNNVSNNVISNAVKGISISSSTHNNIFNNEIVYSREEGIRFWDASYNKISKNNISLNDEGIHLRDSVNNTITNNSVFSNKRSVYSYGSSDNKIYHNNFINHSIKIYESIGINQWDNGYPSGGNYWFDYKGNDTYKGPGQNISGMDGIGDTNYTIKSDSCDNYPLMSPIANLTFFYEGWNLISIPNIQPDSNPGIIFSKISGSYDSFQWYNINDSTKKWKHNHTLKSSQLNDLNYIDHTMGLLIHIIKPGGVLFYYPGTQPASNQSIQLHPGWNQVGYPSLTSYNRTEGLNNITFGVDVDAVQWFDAFTKTWHFMGPDDIFVPGRGYWVHSLVDAAWEVPL